MEFELRLQCGMMVWLESVVHSYSEARSAALGYQMAEAHTRGDYGLGNNFKQQHIYIFSPSGALTVCKMMLAQKIENKPINFLQLL